jgi:ParB family transcriptional regulator, chromosome partitioning protein
MNQQQKRRLGRGLAALIGDDVTEETFVQDVRSLRHLPIETIAPNPNNPRRTFDDGALEELAQSIREKGLLQPLVVRPRTDGQGHEIVAGERRWRAAQRAGLHELPVLVREVSDAMALEIALVENVQRSDLNALEEAQAYAQLIAQFDYTQQQLAEAVGKSRSHIANTLRLLQLPESVRAQLEQGQLTAGHARTLVAAGDAEALADRIVKLGLSVREAEELARQPREERGANKRERGEKDPNIQALESALSEALGLAVEVDDRGRAGGRVVIRYRTLEQLDEICNRLSRRPEGRLSFAAAAERGPGGRAPAPSARREEPQEPGAA